MGRDSCTTTTNEFGEGFLELWGRDSCRTKTNKFGEGFLELWGGIPAQIRVISLEWDS